MTYTYDTSVSCLKRGNNLIPGRVSVKCVPRSGTSFKRMLLTQSPPCRGPTSSAHMFAHVRCCSTRTASHSHSKGSGTGMSLTPINKISHSKLFQVNSSGRLLPFSMSACSAQGNGKSVTNLFAWLMATASQFCANSGSSYTVSGTDGQLMTVSGCLLAPSLSSWINDESS